MHVYLFSIGSQTHVVLKPGCNHVIALYGTLDNLLVPGMYGSVFRMLDLSLFVHKILLSMSCLFFFTHLLKISASSPCNSFKSSNFSPSRFCSAKQGTTSRFFYSWNNAQAFRQFRLVLSFPHLLENETFGMLLLVPILMKSDFFYYSASHLQPKSAPAAGNSGWYGDIPFVDPAILEFGKGLQAAGMNNLGSDLRHTSSPQLNPFDHEARLKLLMQQSSSEYQNLRFQGHLMNRFSPPSDTYGISSTLLNQPQPNNLSSFMQSPAQQYRNAHMSTSHLGSLKGVKSINDLGVSDLMPNGGLGFNKFIPTYEDLKCQMSNSSNVYNRGFAM